MTIFFNALHAPLGAHASFTLGCKGQSGGLGLEMGTPACENVYIGVEDRNRNGFTALPFFNIPEELESTRYDHDENIQKDNETAALKVFDDQQIQRKFSICTDSWKANDLLFSVYNPSMTAPDPLNTSSAEQAFAYCPAVIAELTIDNTANKHPRKAFFGYEGANTTDSMNIIRDLPAGLTGIAMGRRTAMISHADSTVACQGFDAGSILSETIVQNYNFGLGNTGILLFNIPPETKKTFKIAICFYRDGIVTSGEKTSYWYTKFFDSINSVGEFALNNFEAYKSLAKNNEKKFNLKKLNNAQRFQLVHAIKSYYGSTQLLNWDGSPFWVINEGEYRMMNTFDLTVDQLFFEIQLNPWTVKNELDMFARRYSYSDMLHFPGGDNIYEGGISFTHDMGRNNHISRPEYSTYELSGLTGCFSHMTHEQLVNWVLCASVYVKQTNDTKWFNNNRHLFEKCLQSMVNRDNPVETKRNGIMGLDSSRTLDGSEITTYDSLDESLGQARNNIYIAVKSWAAYIALKHLLTGNKAKTAEKQAGRAVKTIMNSIGNNNIIPAILNEPCNSAIIPAIEGLVFPYFMGQKEAVSENGPYGKFIKALKKHFIAVLKKNICLYDDNGWKLSSTADNSWLSKIYLCQFVAREILGIKTDETGILADEAHMKWLLKEENLFFAWSDQMHSGVALGSKYYPRGVTSILRLSEKD